MKIIEPKVEFLSELNISPESHIARCARVCYGKEYKEPNQEADKKMVDGLIKRQHLSMLRHSSIYLVFANDELPIDYKSEYVNYIGQEGYIYISTNRQFMLENNCEAGIDNRFFLYLCKKYPKLFELYRMTFCITTQISTSRELNRVSPNNIAERSTRYCSSKDGLEICKPWWYDNDKHGLNQRDYNQYCRFAEEGYNRLLGSGMKPEDARGLLPLDTATKVIYTYSVQEWQHILDLRLYDKTGKAHPNCHMVMQMVKDQINDFAKEHNINYQV